MKNGINVNVDQNVRPIFQENPLKYMIDNSFSWMVNVDNVNQISSCEAILALISRKDVGTAFEIGLAKGLGRKIYLLTLDETDYNSVTNIMLAYSTIYRIQLKDLWKFIIGKTSYEDLIQIPDTWENKE